MAAAAERSAKKPPRRRQVSTRLDTDTAEGKELSFGEHEDCLICMDTLTNPIKLPCGHWFCKECIKGLRQAKSVQDLCPTCREPLPPGAHQLFDEAWQLMRQVMRKMERRNQGWAKLPVKLQKEVDTVRQLWKQAAAQNNPMAQFHLGVLYEHGQGVPQSHKTAMKWYEKGAEQGHAESMCNLGSLYAQGLGVPLNLVKAKELFEMAVDNGNDVARANLIRANVLLATQEPTRDSEPERPDQGERGPASTTQKKGNKKKRRGEIERRERETSRRGFLIRPT